MCHNIGGNKRYKGFIHKHIGSRTPEVEFSTECQFDSQAHPAASMASPFAFVAGGFKIAPMGEAEARDTSESAAASSGRGT